MARVRSKGAAGSRALLKSGSGAAAGRACPRLRTSDPGGQQRRRMMLPRREDKRIRSVPRVRVGGRAAAFRSQGAGGDWRRRGAPEFHPFARQGSKAADCRQLQRTAEPARLQCSKPDRHAREAGLATKTAETRKQCRSRLMGPGGPSTSRRFPSIPRGDRPEARSARLRQARGPDEPRKRLSEERPGLALRRGWPALPPALVPPPTPDGGSGRGRRA